MRGKDLVVLIFKNLNGITPAYAGKSAPFLTLPGIAWDHPRVCGEKVLNAPCAVCLWGSPPRMRGKETCQKSDRLASRITPAYAGKSCARELLLIVSRDHPRVCGEKEIVVLQKE